MAFLRTDDGRMYGKLIAPRAVPGAPVMNRRRRIRRPLAIVSSPVFKLHLNNCGALQLALRQLQEIMSRLSVKLRIEGNLGRLEVRLLEERRSFRRTVLAVHPAVFPLDRKRALIANIVQSDDDFLEIDIAVAD